jgi:hypothetical protein
MDPVGTGDRQASTPTGLAEALAPTAGLVQVGVAAPATEWIDYQAACPCGRTATWYARAVLMGRPGRPSDHHGARYTRVEYVIDCACSPQTEAA